MRNPTNRCAIVQHRQDLPGYVASVTDSLRIEDILHRVNNLLGTIEIQSEVARAVGTSDALIEAIDYIVESARKTRADLDELRNRQQNRGGA
ncbi:MAG: hypothetical protein ACI89X_001088 [Planctomycetota bacterium]|jgi:hypothetical protein